ncbi:MAG TPA: hypothetical protein VGY13_14405 [Solirubrobacteraceae bacterium]|jgi:hypothetical protein|nr:hypothetical protein [Solirubrobacteraceae bacterium]
MRSTQLQAALTEFVQDAGARLHAEVQGGAEVPFELETTTRQRGLTGTSLYCYRALTGEFIAARQGELERLASHAEAARQLAGYEGLDRYLGGVTGAPPGGEPGTRVRAALLALLQDVFEEQSDFELHPERMAAALERLHSSTLAGAGELTLVATLHGMAISTPELRLARGLTIAQPQVLEGLPEGARGSGASADAGVEHLVVVLAAGEGDPLPAIARGRAILKDLLRALRLFGDGRVTLGALAWVRVGEGRWGALALGTGGRPHGMLVVTAEQEDELRAFCNLVSRRAPHDNEIAWALRRFELGCERTNPLEALSDHLLALRALLEPEGPASGLLAGRLAALCATPERRMELTHRALAAQALERELIGGLDAAAEESRHARQELAREVSDHLRALLRDVICGHLDANLVAVADRLLLDGAREPVATDAPPAPPSPAGEGSLEQLLGDPRQAQEILDVFI